MDTDFFILHFEGNDIIINAFVANKEKGDIVEKNSKKTKTRTIWNEEWLIPFFVLYEKSRFKILHNMISCTVLVICLQFLKAKI